MSWQISRSSVCISWASVRIRSKAGGDRQRLPAVDTGNNAATNDRSILVLVGDDDDVDDVNDALNNINDVVYYIDDVVDVVKKVVCHDNVSVVDDVANVDDLDKAKTSMT